MAAKILNVEVGKRITKICVSEKKGKAYQISNNFFFNTPANTVVDGQIIDVDAFSEKMKTEMAEHGVSALNVVFTLSSSKVATREVMLPPVKADQIQNIVTTNASEYFPIDITKYVVSSAVLERTKEECRVMVVAVPSAIVDSYIQLAYLTGLTIEAIDFGGNSQYQVLKTLESDGVDMYITVDTHCSCVTFMENGEMLMQRVLPVGGDEMVARFIAVNELDCEDYIGGLSKLNVSVDFPVIDYNISDLSDCLVRISNGITRSLDYFRNGKHSDKEIGRVVLMGSCSHIAGLKDQIASAVGVNAYWLEELEDMKYLANSIDEISTYISCIGARLDPMDFLPVEYKKKNKTGNTAVLQNNYGMVVLIAAAVLSVLLLGSTFFSYYTDKSDLYDIEEGISDIYYAEEVYNTYISYKQSEDVLRTFVDGSVTPNAQLKAFFNEMEKKMPSDITLLNASCTNEGVSMNVTCPGYEEAAVIIRQFRSFNTIDVVSVSAISKSSDESGAGVSFSISCLYPVAEVSEVAE